MALPTFAGDALLVDVLRLGLALVGFAVMVQLAVLGWLDRGSERSLAQAALILSLGLIVVDSIVRVESGDPFVVHVFAFRAAIAGIAAVYAVKRLVAVARTSVDAGSA